MAVLKSGAMAVLLKRKNKGNVPLSKAIDKLIKDVDENDWKDQT